MNLDTILWTLGSVAEAAVIALLLYRRVWRTFPAFFLYSVWSLLGSVTDYVVFRSYRSGYITAYLTVMVLDSCFLFGVFLELAWSTLRPVRASLPRGAFLAVGFIILAAGGVLWPFTTVPGAAHLSKEFDVLLRLQQTSSILSVVIFLALAGFSQLLSIGWRNRELQIATGLGIYSLVSVTVSVLHTHPSMRAQYNLLDEFVVASYLCSLLYWIVSFAQQEQERREFTPQMQSFLLAVAGSARATRSALASSTQAKPRNHRDL